MKASPFIDTPPKRYHSLRDPIGRLDLHIAQRDGKSYSKRQYYHNALRVIRPHYLDDSGQVYYQIVNPGGGYLRGDDYHITVRVDEGASLLLSDQSATKIYKTPDDRSLQDVHVVLGEDAVFEYLPDQLIAYEDASYAQFMNVQMDSSASLVTAEIVTPGWSPDGTRFKFQDVRLHTTVEVDGKLAVLDNLLILPGSSEFTEDSILYMEDKTHVGSLLAVDRRIDAALLDELREYLAGVEFKETVRFGVTLIDGPGLALRSLGTLTEDLYLLNTEVANFLRAKFRGQPRLHLRKY